MDPKSLFTTKTFWFNVFAGLAELIPGIADHIPQPWGALVIALGNIILRYVTTNPVYIKAKPDVP